MSLVRVSYLLCAPASPRHLLRYETERTILVQNVGDKPTKFLLRTQAPFSTSIKDGYLDVHGAVQVPPGRRGRFSIFLLRIAR